MPDTASELRRFRDGHIVLATHNEGKISEFRVLLANAPITVTSSADHGLQSPDETDTTFAGNAAIKARAAMQATGFPAIADDSGLTVDALGGEPGVATADWAATPRGRDYAMAMQRVWSRLETLQAPEPRRAQFRSTLCVVWPDGHEQVYAGITAGRLVWPPRGELGFGFDPMFVPDESATTFGEMDPALKNSISHRARAIQQFEADCLGVP